ncbi:MAG: 2-oxoacid:acceptor oxidoreductase family protein [Bacteroidota bacterium]|nr:2-oxoacid:acceptor oxidoreductase family protein [Bacteroidota bacterium]
MVEEVIFAGFGGQGVLSMGQVLAYSGMIENREVCWMPSYGPEMRGGTANCIVTVSSDEISSPIIGTFDTVVALNQPSLDKFESAVRPGGTLIYDSTNIIDPPTRSDIDLVPIPASEEAVKLKNTKIMNMIVLGAFIAKRDTVQIETVLKALKQVLPERHHHLIPLNEQALQRGRELANAAVPVA